MPEFSKNSGRKGANQACACGKLGGECTFFSVVGDDGSGEILLESLQAAGVHTEKVAKVKGCTTGMAAIMVNAEGNNSIVIVAGANQACDRSYVEKQIDVIRDADVVLTQLETPEDGVFYFIRAAKAAGKIVILNPAPAPGQIPDDILRDLDYITPNETELNTLTDMPVKTMDEIEKAAMKLFGKGVRNVIVTIGSRGALLCNASGCKVYPAFNYLKPVDTTAAGDTFNAGLAVGVAEGMNLEQSIRLANAAAAISITRSGAQTSIPTREEVNQSF